MANRAEVMATPLGLGKPTDNKLSHMENPIHFHTKSEIRFLNAGLLFYQSLLPTSETYLYSAL